MSCESAGCACTSASSRRLCLRGHVGLFGKKGSPCFSNRFPSLNPRGIRSQAITIVTVMCLSSAGAGALLAAGRVQYDLPGSSAEGSAPPRAGDPAINTHVVLDALWTFTATAALLDGCNLSSFRGPSSCAFGPLDSLDGSPMVALPGAASATVPLRGLAPGAAYTLKFVGTGQFSGDGSGNNLRVAVSGRLIFSAPTIAPRFAGDWNASSAEFVAAGAEELLTFFTTDPLGGARNLHSERAFSQPPAQLRPRQRRVTLAERATAPQAGGRRLSDRMSPSPSSAPRPRPWSASRCPWPAAASRRAPRLVDAACEGTGAFASPLLSSSSTVSVASHPGKKRALSSAVSPPPLLDIPPQVFPAAAPASLALSGGAAVRGACPADGACGPEALPEAAAEGLRFLRLPAGSSAQLTLLGLAPGAMYRLQWRRLASAPPARGGAGSSGEVVAAGGASGAASSAGGGLFSVRVDGSLVFSSRGQSANSPLSPPPLWAAESSAGWVHRGGGAAIATFASQSGPGGATTLE